MDFSETKHLPKVDHTPAELSEDARVLMRAADYMEINGKSEGGFTTSAKCALLTISHVAGGFCSSAEYKFRRHCEALGYVDISDFNHQHTKDEVVAKLRAVAFVL